MHYFLAGGGGLLSFETGFGIWVLISTLLFLWAMNKWLVPPIMNALKEREATIKSSLESAEKALVRAEEVSRDNEKALKEAEVAAQKIRKQAIEEAELLRTERIEKSKAEADKLLSDARQVIEQEKKRALNELRNEVAQLAVEGASIILKAELDSTKNRELVNSYIEDLTKSN